MPKNILIVEDDRLTRRSLILHLTKAGYVCHAGASIVEALTLAQTCKPDLLLLDIGLPDIDGLEGLRLFRASFPRLPVIFLTARRRELDQIIGLELGADDYITKPFDIDVLTAHIKTVLRRTSAAPPAAEAAPLSPVVAGDLIIDPTGRVVTLGNRTLDLTPKEFDLLLYLAQRTGAVVGRQDILKNVWGEDWVGEEQTVYVHIHWLRTKLEENPNQPRRLLTVPRSGYKLMAVN